MINCPICGIARGACGHSRWIVHEAEGAVFDGARWHSLNEVTREETAARRQRTVFTQATALAQRQEREASRRRTEVSRLEESRREESSDWFSPDKVAVFLKFALLVAAAVGGVFLWSLRGKIGGLPPADLGSSLSFEGWTPSL